MPQGAWTVGDLLVVSHGAVLPPYCVKCGRPSEPTFFAKSFRWHPQWVYIFILLALLLYAILAAVMSKRMTVQVPLCSRHLEKYKSLRSAGAVLTLGSIPEMIIAGSYFSGDYMAYGITAGVLALLAGLVCLLMYGAMLRPTYIGEHHAFFAHANPAFLQMLPPPPPGLILPR
jgi:hypothetical protein